MSKFISLLLLLAAGFGAYIFLEGNANNAQHGERPNFGNMAMPVKTAEAVISPLSQKIKAVGSLLSNEFAVIKPEVPGLVTEIAFIEGTRAKKDDLLIKIDDDTLKAEKAQTEAEYELSQHTYNRINKLFERGTTSAQVRDEAYSAMKVAEAKLQITAAKLEKTEIRAPFDGIIGLREISEGDYVEVGKTITNLEDIDPIKVEFAIPERYFSSINVGQIVEISVDSYRDKTFEGMVYAIDPKIDPDTRNVLIKASISNGQELLRPGMFAYVSLQVGKNENALLIPEETLIPSGKNISVFRVTDGIAHLTPVTTGRRLEGRVEITEGLAQGDKVVTAGHTKIQDGMPVSDIDQGMMLNGKPR